MQKKPELWRKAINYKFTPDTEQIKETSNTALL